MSPKGLKTHSDTLLPMILSLPALSLLCAIRDLLDPSMPVLEVASAASCCFPCLWLLAWVSPSPSHEVLGTSYTLILEDYGPGFLHCNVWINLEICLLAAPCGCPALPHQQAFPQP